MTGILFEDSLDVRQLNIDGKKFERVNRLHCKSNDYDVDVVLGTKNNGSLLFFFPSLFIFLYAMFRCELRTISSKVWRCVQNDSREVIN